MQLFIDCREHKIIEEMRKLNSSFGEYGNINAEVKQLDLGDIIIESENRNIIIERKTHNDLLSSVKDGRYEEQSLRLSHTNIPNHNIIYLIEGKLTNPTKDNKMIISCITSLLIYKGFSVICTNNVIETCLFICQMYTKLAKDIKKEFYYSESGVQGRQESEKSYSDVIKKVKKENISPENISEIMLSQIPNVSSTISKIIINKFGNMRCLCKELEINPSCLENLKFTDKSGKERKINKSALKNITEFLK
jgi:ERCC4-type nuclease